MSRQPEVPSPDYRKLFESCPGLYLVLTPDLHIVAASDAYLDATMTKRADVVGRHLFQVFPDNPDDAAATGVANLSASLQRVVQTRRADTMAVQKYDVRRPEDPDGPFEERHWSPINSPVVDANGTLLYILHQVTDVTEYVRLQQAAKDESAASARTNARVVAMESEILRRSQELQYANRELRALHQQLEERVAERTEALATANASLQRAIEASRDTAAALKATEAQLLHSQRMEAIGHLAGGVAHDFNNLLTVILGFSEIVRGQLPTGSPTHTDLDNITEAGHRAAELTKQLLTFSRRQIREVRVFDLREVADNMRPFLSRLIGESIHLQFHLTAGPCMIEADRAQIEQVIMNLVVNARDAMPGGGKLTVSVEPIVLDAAFTSQRLELEPGPYAQLSVSDSGCGMDKATQERIFEPFFTTKEVGKGTGLGLSTVYGIVKVSRGGLWVYSEVGTGTTFKVYLPLSPLAADDFVAEAPQVARAKPTERILLVEDDAGVRTVATRILVDAGYEVLAAHSPEEALQLARSPDVTFDALITDVVMPGLSGRRLAELVQAIRPRIRVLLMSGYTDDVVLQSGVMPTDSAFVQKPLSTVALTNKLRTLLDRAPA